MTFGKETADRTIRCAIYTRKSTTRGLEDELNSLETQRGVCQAYIKCHSHRNWIELPHRYDDGGFSGGNLQRPALQRLIMDKPAPEKGRYSGRIMSSLAGLLTSARAWPCGGSLPASHQGSRLAGRSPASPSFG